MCARCPRTQPEACAGRMEDVLDELLLHREPRALRECLGKVRALGEWGRGSEGREVISLPLVLSGWPRPVNPFSFEGLSAPI